MSTMPALLVFCLLGAALGETPAADDRWTEARTAKTEALPASWSWPDLQRTSYTVIIEKCPQPCSTKPLLGLGYMYLDYTVDTSSPKIFPRWFFSDVYDRGTLDRFAPQQYDAVIGAGGNYVCTTELLLISL